MEGSEVEEKVHKLSQSSCIHPRNVEEAVRRVSGIHEDRTDKLYAGTKFILYKFGFY